MSNSFNSHISGEITLDTLVCIQKEFKAHIEAGASEIRLYINSPGGNVHAGLTLHEMIKNCDFPVLGIAEGECDSIALTVLQACKSRCAKEDVTFLVHFLTFSIPSRVYYDSDFALSVRDTHMSLQEDIIRIHAERSGISRDDFVALLLANRKLNALQARKYGIIDGIIMGGH